MSDHFVDANKKASFENSPETKRCSKDTIYRQAAIEEVETRLKAAYVWYDDLILKDDYRLSAKADGTISAFIECVLMLKGLPAAEPDVPDTSVGDMISRQAAIDALLGITAIRNTIPLDSAIFNIKKLPSAEPEIIRCKDCKWYQTNYSWNGKEHKVCANDESIRHEDDFCSFAERRTDGKTPD